MTRKARLLTVGSSSAAVTGSPSSWHLRIFVIPLEEGRFLVYAPLRSAAFVTKVHGVNALADLQDDGDSGADDELLALLGQLQTVDGGPDGVPNDIFSGPPQPTSVTLFLTTACNLRCTYCYAAAGDTPMTRMTLATAKRGIDFVLLTKRRGQGCGRDRNLLSRGR